jgi:hypothetical protein
VRAILLGPRLELSRIRSCRRLRHTEGLQPQFAGRDLRQIALLLLLAAVPQQCSHDVHLRMARTRHASRRVDLFQDHCGRAQRQARSAVFFRNKRRQKPGIGQRLDEIRRVAAHVI